MNSQSIQNPAGYTTDATDTHVPRAERKHENYERLIARTKDVPAVPTAVVWPCEAHALAGPVDAANANHGPRISTENSAIGCYVVPTNEELMIARQSLALVRTHAS